MLSYNVMDNYFKTGLEEAPKTVDAAVLDKCECYYILKQVRLPY